MSKTTTDDLLFLPLGGSNEIGMNVNLYRHKGKWLMIDLGAGFADEHYPGVQMLAPDLSFIIEQKNDLVGIVLTHAHEDHIGSIGRLYDKLRCPIYASKFTAEMAKSKLAEYGLLDEAEIHIIEPNTYFDIGPFALRFIQITHSVPEMNAVTIKTEHGTVLHTGDWKFDPNPVEGDITDTNALKSLGKEGVLALVCDSTNVFNDRFSGSEQDLEENLLEVSKNKDGLVVVTTFASNVARMHTIAKVAKKLGRKVLLAGFSMRKISGIAKQTGFLQDIDPFISDKEYKNYKKNELLVMCTGCQGEERAAMAKIAKNQHPYIRLDKKDTIIFSSKIIPGNEKKIFKLFNVFVHIGCEVITEYDHKIHVSGHPSREELTEMYSLTKPKIAIPVHGEPIHLAEHVRLAKSLNVPKAISIKNGDLYRLAPDEPCFIKNVQSGYLAVDEKLLQPEKGDVMEMRRKMQHSGIIFVTFIFDEDSVFVADPIISTPGILDEREYKDFLKDMKEELLYAINSKVAKSNDKIYKTSRQIIKRMIKKLTGKKPTVEIQIARV